MLEVDKISKSFPLPWSLKTLLRSGFSHPGSSPALDNISFSLPKGRILAVLGPNGAGKTTLLKILSTLVIADAGQIRINGQRLGRNDDEIKSILGLVMDEERSFYWRLTGRQNLEFFSSLYGLNRRAGKERIAFLLDLFRIDYADRSFFSYSAGMRKNFALIRGLLHDPRMLLFDEPTKSLDYPSADALRNFIRTKLVKEQGKTVIFTTHQINEAANFADLYLILDKGRKLAFGTLETLKESIKIPDADLSRIFLELTRGHDK